MIIEGKLGYLKGMKRPGISRNGCCFSSKEREKVFSRHHRENSNNILQLVGSGNRCRRFDSSVDRDPHIWGGVPVQDKARSLPLSEDSSYGSLVGNISKDT